MLYRSSLMVHRPFKRDDERKRSKIMAPLNSAKREVADPPDLSSEVSRRMGELLLRGHTMLNEECACGGILMEDRRSGVRTCIACEVREEDTLTSPTSSSAATPQPRAALGSTVDPAALREYVSTNMGRLLLKGYTMLDANCRVCACILMADRTGVRTCLACEFKERTTGSAIATDENGAVVLEMPLNGPAPGANQATSTPDLGFHVVEMPLNGQEPARSTAIEYDECDDKHQDRTRDVISARMGDLLLKGVAMLDEYCVCGGIIMQERSGRKLCVECEVRKEEDKSELKQKIVEDWKAQPAKKVTFQDGNTLRAIPTSDWQRLAKATIEAKLIWLARRLERTEDYHDIALLFDLIEKASSLLKNI